MIQDVINKTAEINSALGARASAVVQSSSDISHALLEQLRQLAEQGKDLPAALVDVSFIVQPPRVQADEQGVGKATGDVRNIAFEKDATLQEKSNKLGAYVLVSLACRCSTVLTGLGSRQARRRRDLQLRPRSQGTYSSSPVSKHC